jgi:hypothetical protein
VFVTTGFYWLLLPLLLLRLRLLAELLATTVSAGELLWFLVLLLATNTAADFYCFWLVVSVSCLLLRLLSRLSRLLRANELVVTDQFVNAGGF